MNKRERHELPIDETRNGERLITIKFDVADAAMLLHAMRIQTTKVMMSGSGKAAGRMLHYERKFREACPPGHKHFRNEEDISNIAFAMFENEKCQVMKLRKYSSSKDCEFRVTIGKQSWSSRQITNEDFEEVVECLKAICPLSCEIEVEERIEYRW